MSGLTIQTFQGSVDMIPIFHEKHIAMIHQSYLDTRKETEIVIVVVIFVRVLVEYGQFQSKRRGNNYVTFIEIGK